VAISDASAAENPITMWPAFALRLSRRIWILSALCAQPLPRGDAETAAAEKSIATK
jgi:hypothetical protein